MASKKFYQDYQKNCLIKFLLVFSAVFAGNASAKEWYIQPSFSLRTEYDDNKRLFTDTFLRSLREQRGAVGIDSYGIITTADVKTGVRSDNYDVFFKGKVAVKKFFSDLDLDHEDFFLDFKSSYKLDARNTFGLTAGYNQESTLSAGLDVSGVLENIPRRTWTVSPDWMFLLAEDKYLQANYSHTDVSYGESETSRYTDYTYDSVSLTFFHQWNAKLQNFATVGWSRFEQSEVGLQVDEVTINTGLNYSFSETWTASIMGGLRFTKTDGFKAVLSENLIETNLPSFGTNGRFRDQNGNLFEEIDGTVFLVGSQAALQPFSDEQTGLVFTVSTEKQFEKGNANISYSRSTSPSGTEGLRTVDRFSFDSLYKITQHLHFLLNGAIHMTKSTENTQISRDRTYYTVTPQLRWQFNRQLSMSGGYRYRRQVYEPGENSTSTITSTAESNAVFITLKYQWDKFSTQEF